MTGEKNRFKTFEKMNKLDDRQLSTPEHDELVLELLNPVNHIPFLKCIGYNTECNASVSNKECNVVGEIDNDTKRLLIERANQNLAVKINNMALPRVKTEVPVVSGYNNFVIGYIDVTYNVPVEDYYKIKSNDITHINGARLNISGTVYFKNDSFKHINSNHKGDTAYKLINIEVKPYVESFGETMRQLNTYRLHFMKDGDYTAEFVIFSPDTRFKEAFEAQGIKFVSPADCLKPNFNSLWYKRIPKTSSYLPSNNEVVKKEENVSVDWWDH